MSDHVCPRCDGKKEMTAFVDGRRTDGSHWGDLRTLKCFTCKGGGTVTDKHMERIKAGEMMRENRVQKGLGLREAAKQLGIIATELSSRERGDLPDGATP